MFKKPNYRFVIYIVFLFCTSLSHSQTPNRIIQDLYTDKARYVPGDTVIFTLRIENKTDNSLNDASAVVSYLDLGNPAAPKLNLRFYAAQNKSTDIHFKWVTPTTDFRGYLVDVRLRDKKNRELDNAVTAVDVSSDWSRFPRYGYLAHFDKEIDTKSWVQELNKYHINGLQFYDFQYKHHWPLAGTIEQPADEWKDIAGRSTNLLTIMGFLNAAHSRNIMSMAYNASYGAYSDALHDGSGVKLQWAAWTDPTTERVEETIKTLGSFPESWSTQKLFYMNQNNPEWQSYIYGKMADLFKVYPFDGWHIDTYGDTGAYAYDFSKIDYVSGFRSFADKAHDYLQKRIIFNTVGTRGQSLMTKSKVDFIYSELWEEHATYSSLLACADEIHTANPTTGIVFPAYMHKPKSNSMSAEDSAYFNVPSVLLTDAVMFASGASHLELGDGGRMLSTEYFPDDQKFQVSPALQTALRSYYDFQVAYENYLRDQVKPVVCKLAFYTVKYNYQGNIGSVWTFSRVKGKYQMIHLINLTNTPSNHWRDDNADYPDAPLLKNIRVQLRIDKPIEELGWASPDVDGGRYNEIAYSVSQNKKEVLIDFTIPSLKYWDMLVVKYK